jgi:hypothetical protein
VLNLSLHGNLDNEVIHSLLLSVACISIGLTVLDLLWFLVVYAVHRKTGEKIVSMFAEHEHAAVKQVKSV